MSGVNLMEASSRIKLFEFCVGGLQSDEPQRNGYFEHRCCLNGIANQKIGNLAPDVRERDSSVLL